MATLGILTVVIGLIAYLRQRQRKILSYQFVSIIPLLSVKDEVKGDLDIFYRGKKIQQLHLILCKIINGGNVPIKEEDYKQPVVFSFNEKTHVLTAEIVQTNPPNLNTSTSIQETKVVLAPVLLNGGDSITIRILVTNYDKQPEINGHIVGVRRITEKVERNLRYIALAIIGLIIEFSANALTASYQPFNLVVALAGGAVALYGITRFVRSL